MWTPEWLEERCLLAGDMMPPQILDVEAVTDARGRRITTVVLTASEAMAEPAAETEANFRTRLPGRDKRLGTADDVSTAPRLADYDPATRRITLRQATPLKRGTVFQVTANAAAGGLTDEAGIPLDANGDGTGSDPFAITLARGTSLKFNDANGDQVSLKLTGGDALVHQQGPGDAAPRLEFLNLAPGTSDGTWQPVPLTGLTIETANLTQATARLAFHSLPEGEYRLVVKGVVTDRYNNPLGVGDPSDPCNTVGVRIAFHLRGLAPGRPGVSRTACRPRSLPGRA